MSTGSQEMKPTVLLYAQENLGLIIPYSSGIIFQQQTGGFACVQNSMEGIFVPLDDCAGHAQELDRFFTGPKWKGSCYKGIDMETADFIDFTLAQTPHHSTIKVDRNSLDRSHEAWVYVFIADPHSTEILEGFPPGGAILTWPNSD